MKLSFENNGTRLQLETPKQFDMATGTAFLALASKVLTGDESANYGLTITPVDKIKNATSTTLTFQDGVNR